MTALTIDDFNRPHEDAERQRQWNCATYYPLCISWELITQYGISEIYTFSYYYSNIRGSYVCVVSVGAPQKGTWEYFCMGAITRYVGYFLNLIVHSNHYNDSAAQADFFEGAALLDPEIWTIQLVGTKQIRVPHERFTC